PSSSTVGSRVEGKMLANDETAKSIERVVHEVVLNVVRRNRADAASVCNDDRLHSSLGLGSLDLAEIVAKLETALGVDPFAEHVAVTSIRTVGDLRKAYVDAIARTDDDTARSGTMLSPRRIPERNFAAAGARR